MGLAPYKLHLSQVGSLLVHTAADNRVRVFGCTHLEMDCELGAAETYLREKGEDMSLQHPW